MNAAFPLSIWEQTKGIFIHFYKHSPLQTNTGRGAHPAWGEEPEQSQSPHISRLHFWRIPGRRSHSWNPKIFQHFSRIFSAFFSDFFQIFFFQNFSRFFFRIFPEFFQNFSRIFPEFSSSSQVTAGTWTLQCYLGHGIPKEPPRMCGVKSQLKSLFKAKSLVFSDPILSHFLFSCWGI